MITVGIPFTAQSLQLFEAISSVFAQTFEEWQLILFGDGVTESTDKIRSIADDRVKIYVEKDRLGLASRLNQIAGLATTPFLARMDSDDVMHPERLAIQLEMLQSRRWDLVGTHAYMIDERGTILGRYNEPPLPQTPSGYLRSNALSHPTVAGSTEWFVRNPYNPEFLRCQDKELWVRTFRDSRFAKADDLLLFYRITSELSARKQGISSKYDRRIIKDYGPRICGRPKATKLLVNSYAKQGVFRLSKAAGLGRRIYDTKFTPVERPELADATANYLAAVRFPIPGLT